MRYVIWSFKHGQWWAPNHRGYTPDLDRAGRYDADEAGSIVTKSILCESVAIVEAVATLQGAPTVAGLWAA